MNKRIVVQCKGLFIRKSTGAYREISRLEVIVSYNKPIKENELLNPIIIETGIPQSLPGDALKLYEQKLPKNLFDLKECFESYLQENNIPFIYKNRKYIFLENILHRVIEEKEV